MKKIDHESLQKELNHMLSLFDEYCQHHDIRVILAGGTLLGAIRHKGFIPWDDDIDVVVMKDEFEKLISLAKENPYIDEEKRYKILAPGQFPNVYPYIKVIDTKSIVYEKDIDKKYLTGLWLDVFMFSYWPESLEESEKLFKKQQVLKNMNKIYIVGNVKTKKYKPFAIIALPVKGLLKLFKLDSAYWNKKRLAMCCQEPTNYIGNVVTNIGLKDRYPMEYYKTFIKAEFEGQEYYIPEKYDKVLTHFYGDYMTLPKEEDRVIHDFEAYYLEEGK